MANLPIPPNDDLPALRFAVSLTQTSSLTQLKQRFRANFGRFANASMYGFNLVDPSTSELEQNVGVNVSTTFVERYARNALEIDPLRTAALETGRAAYNLALMEEAEWEESEVYRAAYSVHRMRQVVEAPIVAGDGPPIGGIHVAAADWEPDFGAAEVEMVETFGRIIGPVVENLRAREEVAAERDAARAALELSSAAVAISSPGGEPSLNSAAVRMLEKVVDAETALHQVLARPAEEGGFSRRIEVMLRDGGSAIFSGHSAPVGTGPRVATVLELRAEEQGLCVPPLGALTSREAEIAVLVSEGLADREIAAQLHLSHHTVSQYVKRIYRKLEVGSRVGLTRVVLGAPIINRRARRT